MSTQQDTKQHGKDQDKDVRIVVNGRKKVISDKELSFDEVLALADGLPSGPYIVYTITYRRGHGNKPEGTLAEGESVRVKDGMIFNVTATDKS
jgi:hypothetical protein